VDIPFVEVHISDVSKREDFRQISYIAPYAKKRFIGLGFDGYKEAIKTLKNL
jgi:3-dehydroquinate dehydratase-2